MTEPAWKAEMRQVRGIPLPDPVDREYRRLTERWRSWQPTPDDYLKVACCVAVAGVVVYAMACARSSTVSHG